MSDFLDSNLDVSESATATDTPASSGETVETDTPGAETSATEDNLADSSDLFSISEEEFKSIATGEPLTAAEADAKLEETDSAKEEKAEESITDTKTETDDTATETDKAAAEEASTKADASDKLNWDTAPEDFRAQYKNLKGEVQALREDSLEKAFLLDPPKFLDTLKEKSESGYLELVQTATNAAAAENPQGFIDYFVKNNPDLVAQILLGDEKLTVARLRAERETVDPELFDSWDDRSAEDAPALEPAEKAELTRLKAEASSRGEQEQADQRLALLQEVAAPMTDSVNKIYRDAGLEVEPTDTDQVKEFKQFINDATPLIVQQMLATDDKIAPVFKRTHEYINKNDGKSAKELQLSLLSYVESAVEKIAGFSTFMLMNADKAKETPQVKDAPKVVGTAAASGGGNLETLQLFSDDFDVSESEWNVVTRKK